MSNYLLVPSNVQALLVGTNKVEWPDISHVPRSDDDLKNWYVNYDDHLPFSRMNKGTLKSGVHLHWTLPAALMHVRHEGNKEPEQPCIPNRWLVIRMWRDANAKEIAAKASVIESDYVSDNANSGGTPFLFFSTSSVELKYVGRTVELKYVDGTLKGWEETNPAYRFEITSSGWGDPSFAAYYPACKGVLGFHDEMKGVNSGDLLTYFVVGWYSDEKKDPLYTTNPADSFLQRLHDLRWSVPDPSGTRPPRQTLCHGAVVDLKWLGSSYDYRSGIPASSSPTIALGNTAAEALAALLRNANGTDNPNLEQVLCAFQYGEAQELPDRVALADLLHRHCFDARSGGTRWQLDHVQLSKDVPSMPPRTPTQVQRELDALNAAQQLCDREERALESLRWRLFALWVAWMNEFPPPLRDAVDKFAADFKERCKLTKYKDDVEKHKVAVENAWKTAKLEMRLVKSVMPPFLQPKDPFVAIKAIDLTGTWLPSPDADGALRCRLEEELVTGAKSSDEFVGTWQAQALPLKDSFAHHEKAPAADLLGKLAREALLFDPNCAELVSLFKTEDFRALQRRSGEPSGSEKIAWIGRRPDPLAITRWSQKNPWLPVYLMWQVEWAPAYQVGATGDETLKGWKLPQHPGNDFHSPATWSNSGSSNLLQGHTILSLASGGELEKSLLRFVKKNGVAGDHLHTVGETETLAQSLGGLNELLLRQAHALFLPPVDPDKTPLELDSVWTVMERKPSSVIPVDGKFLPIRAGTLKIVDLQIVDSFGQMLKLMGSALTSSRFVTSVNLPSPPAGCHAAFLPRLVQPTRLNFELAPAGDSESGPVCGWLIPNHLEKSLIVLTASGEPIGALESVLQTAGERTLNSPMKFRWRAKPGTDLTVERIGNDRLKRFVQLLVQLSAGEGCAFLELVDRVLGKTLMRTPSDDPAIEVLLGRPLALIDASLGLELAGLPAGYWDWKADAPAFATEGFETLRVPVRLGGMRLRNDGLVGYMSDDKLFVADGATRQGDFTLLRYDQNLSVACVPPGAPVRLTLLMDASARVHATTGILPRTFIEMHGEFARQAKLAQEVYFQVAPVLGEQVAPVPADSSVPTTPGPRMPRPSDAFGHWSWAIRPRLGWQEISAADDRARFTGDTVLSEGWLKLARDRANPPKVGEGG